MPMSTMNITLPERLREKAKHYDINVSEITRIALLREIEKHEELPLLELAESYALEGSSKLRTAARLLDIARKDQHK